MPTGNSSISINGTNISVLTGDTLSIIKDRINNAGLGVTADNSSGSLVLTSNSKITIDGESAGLTALGLEKGTTQVATGNAEKSFTFGAIAAGKISINGTEIELSASDTQDSIIDKINAAGVGVTAKAVSTTGINLSSESGFLIDGDAAGRTALGLGADTGGVVKVKGADAVNSGTISGDASIRLNGETINFQDGSDLDDITNKLNQSTDSTGVTASVNNGRLQLTSSDGKAVKLEDATAGSLSKLGLSAGTTDAKLVTGTSLSLNGTEIKLGAGSSLDTIVTSINTASTGVTAAKNDDGSLSLSSNKNFSVADGAAGTGLAALGLTAGTNTAVTQETSVSDLSITSAEGAQISIQTLDGAIQQIDGERAKLGAVQNRFDNTVANLQSISENATASRSRIQDADFAAETANLTKQQTLQQASTAILAQANKLPQSVLSLLQ
ncbi:flagellin [Azomonas macrocytogenes]